MRGSGPGEAALGTELGSEGAPDVVGLGFLGTELQLQLAHCDLVCLEEVALLLDVDLEAATGARRGRVRCGVGLGGVQGATVGWIGSGWDPLGV
jgi:hypothetical protein